MASRPFPRWTTIRPVLGIVLGVIVVSLVLGRASGLGGGADDDAAVTPENTESTGATPTPDSASPSPTPGSLEPSRAPRAGGGRGGESWLDDSARDPALLDRVEEVLAADKAAGEAADEAEDEAARGTRDPGGEAAAPARFRVSSLNVLGASHTAGRGNKPSYASGVTRIGWIAQLLQRLDVDVVGLQEYELVQHHAFKRQTGDAYGVFPGTDLGRRGVRNSIAWERSTWKAVSTHTIAIPYFRGNRVPMPYVLLEHLGSGRRVWFINIHNPVSSRKRGDNERWRDLATRLEIGLFQRLRAGTGHPVVLMGDFNERQEAFCTVTRRTPAVAANGGAAGPPCAPPADTGIDWIFGSPDISFADYLRLRSGLVSRATDHPMVVATAELGVDPAP